MTPRTLRKPLPRRAQLTESEAWWEIAWRISLMSEPMPYGLCFEAEALRYEGVIDSRTVIAMQDRAGGHAEMLPDRYSAAPEMFAGWFAYPYGEDHNDARLLAALWMACEAEAESEGA